MVTQAEAKALSERGVVVDMKALTGDDTDRPRMDVDDLLYNHTDTFNLMLWALTELQQDKGLLGYYQLAGIHGWPRTTWDRVSQKEMGEWDDVDKRFGDGSGGYCAHSVMVFPTWHRPYLALFEQTIYRKMAEIAQRYDPPYRQTYLDAAKGFRLPYYDYFRARGGRVTFQGVKDPSVRRTSFDWDFSLPKIFNEPLVSLKKWPQNVLTPDQANPLYAYKFTEAGGQLPAQDQSDMLRLFGYSRVPQTVRCPDPRSPNPLLHDINTLGAKLNDSRESECAQMLGLITSRVYSRLATAATDALERGEMTNFDFADPEDGDREASGSLEGSIHGNYHVLIGGGRGHMSNPTVAAFDPIFWFHHCQIDRLWAFWQAANPDSWFPKPRPGAKIAENQKDLLPFYKSKTASGTGQFWNSDDSRYTKAFGYVYDDFAKISKPGKEGMKAYLRQNYEWGTRIPRSPNFDPIPERMKPLPVEERFFFQKKPAPAHRMAAAIPPLHAPILAQTAAAGQKVLATATETVSSAAGAAVASVQAVAGGGPQAAAAPPKIDADFDREWYVDSRVKRSAANGPFTIFFFLVPHGDLTTDSDQYDMSPYLAGLHHVFAAPREGCDNCANHEAAEKLVVSTAPITALLLDYLELPDNGLESMRPEHVKPFLKKYLRWRVVYHGIEKQDPRDVPELKIGVSAKIYHDDGTNTYEVYPDVVDGIITEASTAADA